MSESDFGSRKAVPSSVPGYTPEFGNRMNSVIARIGSLKDAGRAAGVSDEQIARWRDGNSKPNLFGLLALCEAAGVALSWLATGEGQAPSSDVGSPADLKGASKHQVAGGSGIDPELLGRVVDRIAKVYREEGVRLADVDLGRLAAEKYAEIADLAGDPDEWPGFLDVIAARVRKAIRAAAADPIGVKREA